MAAEDASEAIRVGEVCILLLEDSDIDAELLTAHLEKAGLRFQVTRVTNRREFVSALAQGGCEVILADYSLPDFDGLSALSIARSLTPETPFIFVSGVVGEEFATNALKRGATDYVMKRNLTRLATAVERALQQARERDERRRAEAALAYSEMSARLALDAAKLGVWDYDPRSGALHWDERCRQLFGLSSGAVVSYTEYLGRIHPQDRDRLEAAFDEAIACPSPSDGLINDEFRAVLPNGGERWLATRGQALFDKGVCTRLTGVVRDVTEEKRSREALRRLASTLEQQVAERTAERDRIWRLSRDLFLVASFEGELKRVNPAWEALGYNPADLVDRPLAEFIHPDDLPTASEVVRRLGQGQVVERFESRLRNAAGTWRWISWSAAPEGEAFYAVGRDITEEKIAAEALAERNRELAAQIEERERVEATLRQMQRLEAVGQLTSGVAHDFNNLLTVILGNISFVERLLAQRGLDGELVDRIGHMKSAAERGAKLTAQMLAFSRRQRLEPKPVDLNETVAGMRELLQSTMGGSVRIETVLTDDLWPALVDPTQIELIILNLAINARDAMQVGGALSVETANIVLTEPPRRPEEPGPGEYVMLSVSDTGSGMPDEVLAKAFEPFFTTKEVGKGSGLGLAQVYGFAKQSGGGVRIDTAIGQGTSVKVFLPRAEALQASAPEEGPALRPRARLGTSRVLVVDDDPAVRHVTSAMLRDLGYGVVEAASGAAALALLRRGERVDLLLADYAMPGMNGAETSREAQTIQPDLPIMFITGYANLEALEDVGEDRIIQKPFRDDELARKVQAALSRGGDDGLAAS